VKRVVRKTLLARVIKVSELVLLLCVTAAFAGELVPIAAALSNLEFYQLHEITIIGTISDLQPLQPYIGRLGPVTGACIFNIDDGTGTMEVHVSTGCPWPDLNGAKVEVQAVLHVLPSDEKSRPRVIANATILRRLNK